MITLKREGKRKENKMENKIKIIQGFDGSMYWIDAMVKLGLITQAEAGYIIYNINTFKG